jgi:hypothetical protein
MRALFVLALLTLPAPAFAFVPTLTCTTDGIYQCAPNEVPKQVKWPGFCVNWYMNEAGTADIAAGPDGFASTALEEAITVSFDAWNQIDCHNLKLVYGGRTDDDRAATDGRANIVVWRDDTWFYASKTAFAITSVTYNPETGYIADADIEMNSQYHDFTIGDRDINIDTQNTLTHEVGHVVGLDHTPVISATMYANAGVGETHKRTLERDDIDGVCSIYPTEMRDDLCDPAPVHTKADDDTDDGGCCATSPAKPSSTPWMLVFALGAMAVIRRWRG